MFGAARLADRHVLALAKIVVHEMHDRFVVRRAGCVGKRPRAVEMDELADEIAFAVPKAVHGAELGRHAIGVAVEPPVGQKRQDELVPVAMAALRKAGTTGEFEADTHPRHGPPQCANKTGSRLLPTIWRVAPPNSASRHGAWP